MALQTTTAGAMRGISDEGHNGGAAGRASIVVGGWPPTLPFPVARIIK